MARHPLDPAFAKIERAKTHINDLDSAIRAFLKTRPYRFTPKLNERGTEEVWSITVDPLPTELESIAADALHNLRTPLDKMLAAGFPNLKIHQLGAKLASLKFPFADRLSAHEPILVRLEEHLTIPAIEFVRAAGPYEGGAGHTIWAINSLDNRDKHRALLEPIKLSLSAVQGRSFAVNNGWILRMGSARGKHLIPVPDARPGAWHMHQPVESLQPILRMSPATVSDNYVEFSAAYDDMEVCTTTPGAELYANVEPILNVAFNDIKGFEGEPVVKVLETMRQAAEVVLDEFRRAFF